METYLIVIIVIAVIIIIGVAVVTPLVVIYSKKSVDTSTHVPDVDSVVDDTEENDSFAGDTEDGDFDIGDTEDNGTGDTADNGIGDDGIDTVEDGPDIGEDVGWLEEECTADGQHVKGDYYIATTETPRRYLGFAESASGIKYLALTNDPLLWSWDGRYLYSSEGCFEEYFGVNNILMNVSCSNQKDFTFSLPCSGTYRNLIEFTGVSNRGSAFTGHLGWDSKYNHPVQVSNNKMPWNFMLMSKIPTITLPHQPRAWHPIKMCDYDGKTDDNVYKPGSYYIETTETTPRYLGFNNGALSLITQPVLWTYDGERLTSVQGCIGENWYANQRYPVVNCSEPTSHKISLYCSGRSIGLIGIQGTLPNGASISTRLGWLPGIDFPVKYINPESSVDEQLPYSSKYVQKFNIVY